MLENIVAIYSQNINRPIQFNNKKKKKYPISLTFY